MGGGVKRVRQLFSNYERAVDSRQVRRMRWSDHLQKVGTGENSSSLSVRWESVECVIIIRVCWDFECNDAPQFPKLLGDLVYIKCGDRGTTLSLRSPCSSLCAYTRTPQRSEQPQHAALADNPVWVWVWRTDTDTQACEARQTNLTRLVWVSLLWSHSGLCLHVFVKAFQRMHCQLNCDTKPHKQTETTIIDP